MVRGCNCASVAMTCGTSGSKSSSLFVAASKTTTATGRLTGFCWYSKFLSVVISASNPAPEASARSRPFFTPSHPMYATVKQSCPTRCARSGWGMHSSRRSFIAHLPAGGSDSLCPHRFQRSKDCFARDFDDSHRLFAADGREVIEKLAEGMPPLQVVKEALNRHPRPCKARRAAHDFGIDFNRVHAPILCPSSGTG